MATVLLSTEAHPSIITTTKPIKPLKPKPTQKQKPKQKPKTLNATLKEGDVLTCLVCLEPFEKKHVAYSCSACGMAVACIDATVKDMLSDAGSTSWPVLRCCNAACRRRVSDETLSASTCTKLKQAVFTARIDALIARDISQLPASIQYREALGKKVAFQAARRYNNKLRARAAASGVLDDAWWTSIQASTQDLHTKTLACEPAIVKTRRITEEWQLSDREWARDMRRHAPQPHRISRDTRRSGPGPSDGGYLEDQIDNDNDIDNWMELTDQHARERCAGDGCTGAVFLGEACLHCGRTTCETCNTVYDPSASASASACGSGSGTHVCCAGDVSTWTLIKQTTKKCPKCHLRLQKQANTCNDFHCEACRCSWNFGTGERRALFSAENPHETLWQRKVIADAAKRGVDAASALRHEVARAQCDEPLLVENELTQRKINELMEAWDTASTAFFEDLQSRLIRGARLHMNPDISPLPPTPLSDLTTLEFPGTTPSISLPATVNSDLDMMSREKLIGTLLEFPPWPFSPRADWLLALETQPFCESNTNNVNMDRSRIVPKLHDPRHATLPPMLCGLRPTGLETGEGFIHLTRVLLKFAAAASRQLGTKINGQVSHAVVQFAKHAHPCLRLSTTMPLRDTVLANLARMESCERAAAAERLVLANSSSPPCSLTATATATATTVPSESAILPRQPLTSLDWAAVELKKMRRNYASLENDRVSAVVLKHAWKTFCQTVADTVKPLLVASWVTPVDILDAVVQCEQARQHFNGVFVRLLSSARDVAGPCFRPGRFCSGRIPFMSSYPACAVALEFCSVVITAVRREDAALTKYLHGSITPTPAVGLPTPAVELPTLAVGLLTPTTAAFVPWRIADDGVYAAIQAPRPILDTTVGIKRKRSEEVE